MNMFGNDIINAFDAAGTNSDNSSSIEGFMCQTDYDCELGWAAGGVPVYSSEEDLRKHRSCVGKGCGIVRVRVLAVEVVQEEDVEKQAEYDNGPAH